MIENYRVRGTFAPLVCLMMLFAFVLLFSTTSAKAQAFSFTSNYTQQVFPTSFSGCAGGNLILDGQMHFVFHFTETPSGPRLFRSHINYQGVTATDQSGNQYALNSNSNDVTILEDELRTATVVQYFRLIGRGQNAKEYVRNVNHVTFNDNGEITSLFSKFYAECNN